MANIMDKLGVCSWSLRPRSPRELAEKITALGIRRVQLHLDPVREGAWRADETACLLRLAHVTIASGMMGTKGEDYSTLESIKMTGGVRPDEHWESNLRAAEGNAIFAARMGIPLVTLHAGFLPHDGGDPLRARMVDRLRQMAEIFAARNVRLALETGQEDADTLLGVLRELNSALPERARVGVNFDPANMILYGMGDPIEALRKLAPHVRQIHIKDAKPAPKPGVWGSEEPAGSGAVDWQRFFEAARGLHVDFMIERESGESRENDIALARDLVRRIAG
ncbi:MAG TPA: sugar phosphate isomerase/epimerase family protein [Phycisphaerales bacterium]